MKINIWKTCVILVAWNKPPNNPIPLSKETKYKENRPSIIEYSKIVINAYAQRYKGKPTDMSFKGFECAYLFTKLLLLYPTDMMSHLNDKTYKVFCDYNFRPVNLKKENAFPDYFENKHEYFIKIMNGSISKAW